MKKWITLLLLVSLSGWALAQTESVRDKDLGILFSFNGLSSLGLGSYQDASGSYGLGVKMFKGQKAFRAMLVFGSGSTTHESASQDYVGQKNSSSAFGVAVDGLAHLNPSKISPFIGAGVGFVSNKEKTESGHMKQSKADVTENTESSLFVRGILGVEIFIKKNISLSGEYTLQYQKTSETNKIELGGSSSGASESKIKTSSFGVGATGKLTLAIYFANGLL